MSAVSLLLGPGPYGDRMVQALLDAQLLQQVVRYYPHLRVDRADGPRLRIEVELRSHGAAVRLLWAAWRRLPRLGQRESPRGPLFALVDHLAAAALRPAPLLVGWSQVSLHNLRRARDAGRATLLEHPTAHVDAWMDLIRAECNRFRLPAAYSLLPPLLVRRMRAECGAAGHLCVPSTYARKTLLEAGVPAAKISVVPLGVDARRFHPGPGSERASPASRWSDGSRPSVAPGQAAAWRPAPRPFRVLYVGRLELLKGLPYLLEAFARLEVPGAELWLAGRVLPEAVPLLARHRDHRVRCLGPLPPEAMPPVYRQADVLVLPSLCDSFGLVLLEAMASGLPFIATPHSAGPDLLRGAPCGFVVPLRDADALRDRLRILAAEPDLRRTMGQVGRALATSRYTWEHYAARYRALCRRLLNLPEAAAPEAGAAP